MCVLPMDGGDYYFISCYLVAESVCGGQLQRKFITISAAAAPPLSIKAIKFLFQLPLYCSFQGTVSGASSSSSSS